jgi:hypothetical protein
MKRGDSLEGWGRSRLEIRPGFLDLEIAPHECLPTIDERHSLGLRAFTIKYDTHRDIPLNEKLTQPEIDLSLTEPALAGCGQRFTEHPPPGNE